MLCNLVHLIFNAVHNLGFLLLLTVLQPALTGPQYSSRLVETLSGSVRGVIVDLNSRHLVPVEVFRGVPYAAPPVGSLRFRLPQPVSKWQGTRLAESFSPVCPQRPPDLTNRTVALEKMPLARYNFLKKFVPLLVNQSEDCLYLNIYVPGNGNRGADAPYAVMFFIHGESFEWGAGNPYDGSVVAAYGHVIFITVNFRLGLLGFLRTKPILTSNRSSGGESISNLALCDLVAALRWIRANIGAFGGDPAHVTLVGHGPGAALANLLQILPAARGLFARVTLFSGSALSPWAIAFDPDAQRSQVAIQLGCMDVSSLTDDDISPCLRARSLDQLLDAQSSVPKVRFMSRFAPSQPFNNLPMGVDKAMENGANAFVSSQMLVCVASMESYGDFSASDIQYGFEEVERNRVLRTYIQNAYVYHLNEIFSAVKNEYTDWDKPIQHPINIRDSTLEALSDGHTVAPLLQVAYMHARRSNRTYFGHFGYQSKDSEYPQRLGTVRGEDLTYIIGLPLVTPRANYSRVDASIAEALLTHLTNFAKTGNPNTPASTTAAKHRLPQWDVYETDTQLYLTITAKPKMKNYYRSHKMALWLNLIPQLHQPGNEDVSMRHHHFYEREQHYYAGLVRAESYTRIPPSYLLLNSEAQRTNCTTDSTFLVNNKEDEDDFELIKRLASEHYYSYAAALVITISVGGLLLLLNMIIFACIYYQKGRNQKSRKHVRSNSTHQLEDVAVQSHTSTSSSWRHQSRGPEKFEIKIYKSPSCYNSLPKATSAMDRSKTKRDNPLLPVRSSTNPPDVTIKKRIQVQEISV